MYKAADGSYRSAGTFSTEKRALEVAAEAERHAAEVIGGAAGGLDPRTRATRAIKEYAPLFLRHHMVEGNTKDKYADTLRLHVLPFLGGCRLAETDRTVARNYVTVLLEEGRSANMIRHAKVVLCGASSGGSPAHPAWYDNLKAHPEIIVEVGAETFTVLVEELDHTARAELWPKLVARYRRSANTRPRPPGSFRCSC